MENKKVKKEKYACIDNSDFKRDMLAEIEKELGVSLGHFIFEIFVNEEGKPEVRND